MIYETKMVNNFDKFNREFVEGEFYFISLIKRKKDNPDVAGINGSNHARSIRTYSIRTQEQLDKARQEMIDIATVTNSRIYLRPSRRKLDDVRKMMALLIGENIYYGRHRLSGLYNHACGLCNKGEKIWIVDIDNDGGNHTVSGIKKLILTLRGDAKILQKLPTKNGLHLLTTPFDLQKFKETYPDIDVHKNSPTLLYYNNKNET